MAHPLRPVLLCAASAALISLCAAALGTLDLFAAGACAVALMAVLTAATAWSIASFASSPIRARRDCGVGRATRGMNENECRPVRLGLRDGLGVPGLTLGATYVGLGVMAHSQGLSLAETVASTLLAFSISGQTAFIHATASSVPLLPLGVAVLAANIRLLPLAAGVVAHIRRPDGPPGWFNLVVALLTGATAWGSVTRRADRMPKRALASYAFVVAAVLWLVSTAGIGVGWLLLGVIPPALAAGLAFLAAAYFGILMAAEAAMSGARALAVLSGAVLAPVLAADLGDWAVIVAGLVGAAMSIAQGEWTAARVAAAAAARTA